MSETSYAYPTDSGDSVPGIDRGAHRLQEVTERARAHLGMLEERLAPVLLPPDERAVPSDLVALSARLSPHADRLDSTANALDGLCSRLSDLLGRLDL
jgi:hypothetical protein